MNSLSSHIDKAAISLSVLCGIHCLILPVALVILPVLTTNIVADQHFHQWLLLAVLPTSLIALTMGCRQHLKMSVMVIGILGLTILSFTAFWGHDLFGETGEKIASLFGALLITIGHIRNHNLCNSLRCHCNSQHSAK
ncbi:Uncharacterised protein [Zhongshania aliphaticivorans]|uniref:MerC mercury resistance protein n=1 Tax=Zhongshania aliphaticivorans TaxID=1470434 RepID=A0A5S9P1Y9_9GAMM|nr:MerC domain-containing protein [Zhongshania aliphaticivorans]CAA0090005.1 Uncharacterised protein [Zhongshania aliphaticivorans]CAA0097215.1 Uncharacterised protein [Zhongshania aliphaticivorans]